LHSRETKREGDVSGLCNGTAMCDTIDAREHPTDTDVPLGSHKRFSVSHSHRNHGWTGYQLWELSL